MALTDLTNTKWLFNQFVNFDFTDDFYIDFTNDFYSTSFHLLMVYYDPGQTPSDMKEYLVFSNDDDIYEHVYEDGQWQHELISLRTIEITGGTDVTNSNLISWLESNATQIASTVDIKLGNNTLLGVDTIALTDATDTSNTINFSYGVTPSGTVSVKLGDNTLTNVNTLSVLGSDLTYKSFGYVAQPSTFTVSFTSGYNGPAPDISDVYVKIGSAPTSNTDYDYYCHRSTITNKTTHQSVPQPLVLDDVSVIYLWADDYSYGEEYGYVCCYVINEVATNISMSYSSPTTITLSANTSMYIQCLQD